MSDQVNALVQSRCGLLCNDCAYREPHKCGGCIATDGHPFYGGCRLAQCCQDMGFAHCGQCPDMPCETLYEFSVLDREHGDNPPGARIEQLRRWAAAEKTEGGVGIAQV